MFHYIWTEKDEKRWFVFFIWDFITCSVVFALIFFHLSVSVWSIFESLPLCYIDVPLNTTGWVVLFLWVQCLGVGLSSSVGSTRVGRYHNSALERLLWAVWVKETVFPSYQWILLREEGKRGDPDSEGRVRFSVSLRSQRSFPLRNYCLGTDPSNELWGTRLPRKRSFSWTGPFVLKRDTRSLRKGGELPLSVGSDSFG